VLTSALCAGRSIDPAIVTSRQEVAELYRAIIDRLPTPEIRLLKGWRAQACGQQLLQLLKGLGKVELTWHEGHLRATL
jgi:hypothetical protein